ncbi:hypothetical protein B0H67DRAFT_687924 [Lasiosphaeris hirsuta]|uniref:Uncharacterized protein n=1 Tax=Lasiosphaeris hirsuta TaxID=260670 RepID=A0AA39ZSE5_9PEZI|nr:hypothetical protein B0H67DRAFT_687924 [Lasiosphaeris hirsuta]
MEPSETLKSISSEPEPTRVGFPGRTTTMTVGPNTEKWAIPQIPLTTVWTPPPDCSSIVEIWGIVGFTAQPQSCGPPYLLDAGANEYDYGYYSPGICPLDYTVGCFMTGADVFMSQLPGETVGFCVPRSWSCVLEGYCFLAITPCPSTLTYNSFYAESTTTDTVEQILEVTRALAIQIRWMSSDLSILETPPLRAGVTVVPVTVTRGDSGDDSSTGAGATPRRTAASETTPQRNPLREHTLLSNPQHFMVPAPPKDKALNLSEPRLLAFEMSRPESFFSSGLADIGVTRNIYRHPDRQGNPSRPSTTSTPSALYSSR